MQIQGVPPDFLPHNHTTNPAKQNDLVNLVPERGADFYLSINDTSSYQTQRHHFSHWVAHNDRHNPVALAGHNPTYQISLAQIPLHLFDFQPFLIKQSSHALNQNQSLSRKLFHPFSLATDSLALNLNDKCLFHAPVVKPEQSAPPLATPSLNQGNLLFPTTLHHLSPPQYIR